MIFLSKSRVVAGLQCPKQLWWRVHDPGAPELEADAALEWQRDEGRRVGVLARDYVPGGVLIDLPGGSSRDRARATVDAIQQGARVIYEAGFMTGDAYAQADILERLPAGFALIEVKKSLEPRLQDVTDVAVQTHIARAAGVDVRRIELMHLNRDCVHPDLRHLFVRADVTATADTLAAAMGSRVASLHAVLAGPLPQVAIGPHCDAPRECPFKLRCWPDRLPHGLHTLYKSGESLPNLEAAGYATISDLPAGLDLNAIAERQRRAVQSGRMIVEDGLAEALRGFEAPIAFLDFETVSSAIPMWPGCRPYTHVPVQFSCHLETGDGRIFHEGWIATGPDDPRVELAHRVADACRGARAVAAYWSRFEAECLEQLATAVPARAAELREVAARLIDPLPILRSFVYHPDFKGSFSLKAVLNPLVPELGYDDLEIRDGQRASLLLARLLLDDGPRTLPERERIHEALSRYAERDTWALVKLVGRLRELAGLG